MFTTKTRTTIVAFVAWASVAVAAIAPAASQAQWHNYCVAGHCITHQNYTIGGVSPCTRINEQLGKAEGNVGDDKEWKELHNAGEGNATKELEAAEGEVNRARGEAFEYGCDVAAAVPAPKAVSPARIAAVSVGVQLAVIK